MIRNQWQMPLYAELRIVMFTLFTSYRLVRHAHLRHDERVANLVFPNLIIKRIMPNFSLWIALNVSSMKKLFFFQRLVFLLISLSLPILLLD